MRWEAPFEAADARGDILGYDRMGRTGWDGMRLEWDALGMGCDWGGLGCSPFFVIAEKVREPVGGSRTAVRTGDFGPTRNW